MTGMTAPIAVSRKALSTSDLGERTNSTWLTRNYTKSLADQALAAELSEN
jgi:hypothetical protein